jgi:GT2 family glycosyltransferase
MRGAASPRTAAGAEGASAVGTVVAASSAVRPTLSIVIVSFNCREHLLRCLESLRQEAHNLACEVIVVDNASRDGTVEAVRERYPEVQLRCSPRNRGFAWGSNRGLERASGEHLLLLNPDTVVPPHALARAVCALEERPDIGMLGCKLVRPNGSLDRACKRGFPTPLSSLYHFTSVSRLAPRSRRFAQYSAGHIGENETAVVEAVNGAFMLVRREAVDAVGLLDERYWLYMEDLDWCYRFAQRGWPVLYWPEVEVVHVKAGSSGRHRRLRANYAFHRGMWLFYRTHYAPTRPLPVTAVVWLGIWSKLTVSALRSAVGRAGGRRHRSPRPAKS